MLEADRNRSRWGKMPAKEQSQTAPGDWISVISRNVVSGLYWMHQQRQSVAFRRIGGTQAAMN
ncbi:MAG: hypothetical protein OEW68_09625 [Gammaproteobacteria bacterium]|nr:hypothetical protein [Gammaproteobacteria bacterium]MDH4315088.1 hypothetical protein [Gammaproteobacteria bacterium]